MAIFDETLKKIKDDGYAVILNVFDQTWLDQWLSNLGQALDRSSGAIGAEAVKESKGVVYAARNILSDVPGVDTAWQSPVLSQSAWPDFGR